MPGLEIVLRVVLLVAVMDGLLFGIAGRLSWGGAWLLTALYFPFLVFVVWWAGRHSPGLLAERSRRAANVKPWDRVIGAVYGTLMIVLLATAAIDAGRLRWSRVPYAARGAGCIAAVAAGYLIWAALAANPFLSRWARIQDDRGQTVVRSGPYRFVRHPMYAALIVLMFAIALVLGSWWALIPAALIAAVYVVRTALEDRMLNLELDGYREYARAVRFRLVPGVW